jgi:hypothetical protein
MNDIVKLINERLEILDSDVALKPEIRKLIVKFGIDNLDVISSGFKDTVYQAGDKILKITGDATEFKNAEKLIDNPVSGVIRFYRAIELQGDYSEVASGNSFYLLLMAKIKPVEGILKKIGDTIGENITYPFDSDSILRSVVRVNPAIRRNKTILSKVRDIFKSIKNLDNIGIQLQDFHGDNLGLDNSGKITIFDLGSK